jgi:putative restriction endonuclease
MKFYVGVTDNEWFDFLSARKPDEVNFWQPGGGTFRILEPGELFLFKLHAPYNYIAGGGFFVRHSLIPTSLAWEAFREKNGTNTFEDLLLKINNYRRPRVFEPDPTIGCIILSNPFFFPEDDWIPVPKNWSPSIVRGKTYDTSESTGMHLWTEVQGRLSKNEIPITTEKGETPIAAEEVPLYGPEYLTHARLGQGTFRILVTEAYNRRCSITGERTLPVLEAAHIKPHAK